MHFVRFSDAETYLRLMYPAEEVPHVLVRIFRT